jgi:hypothetical protein
MKFMEFYFEDKKKSLEEKWKLLKFLDEETHTISSEKNNPVEIEEKKSKYTISRLKELFK